MNLSQIGKGWISILKGNSIAFGKSCQNNSWFLLNYLGSTSGKS